MQDIIEKYIATWNETDPARRRALIEELYAADASYTDPLADLRGLAEIDAGVAGAQQMFPGMVFTLAGRWTRITTRRGSAGTSGQRGRSRS